MKLRLTEAARRDLLLIYLSGEQMFGPKQADLYAAGLSAAFQVISKYPLAARLRSKTVHPVRAHSYQSHVIIYAIDEAGVLVLRVRHGQEDWLSDLNVDELPGDPP